MASFMAEECATAAEWLAAARDAERRGELLEAIDLAERGLERHPDDLALRHRAVLCLARSGATEQAAERYRRYRLAEHEDDEDVAALGARIAKDRALALPSADRSDAAGRAADAYLAVFAHTRGYYPAINAATLSLLAGRGPQAAALAREALRALEAAPGPKNFYAAATAAEASMLLGEHGACGPGARARCRARRQRSRSPGDDPSAAPPRLRSDGHRPGDPDSARRPARRPLHGPPDRRPR